MRTSSYLVTAATSEPITVQEAMEHCRVTDTADEQYIVTLIGAVRGYVEMLTGRALAGETRRMVASDWPEYSIDFDRTPIAAVSSVTYYPDGYGAEITVASTDYILADGEPSRIIFKDTFSFPALAIRPDAVRITYTTAPALVPLGLKHAILLQVAHLYEQRASVNIGSVASEMPQAFTSLVLSHRIGGFVA